MSRAGMTLLEVVVGLTVTGLTLAAGYGALGTIVDRRVRADSAMSSIVRAAAIRRTLAAWLDGARIAADEPGPPFRGLDGVRDGLPDDELIFLTTGASPVSNGETVVRLHVDHDTVTPERG